MKLMSAAMVLLLIPAMAFAGEPALVFDMGDKDLEVSLNAIGAVASVDPAGFQAEISLTWSQPLPLVQLALAQGLLPGEVYFAAGLAFVSGKSLNFVVDLYKKNSSKGWGALAKQLGIKPGSMEFKLLKEKVAVSETRLNGGKK